MKSKSLLSLPLGKGTYNRGLQDFTLSLWSVGKGRKVETVLKLTREAGRTTWGGVSEGWCSLASPRYDQRNFCLIEE